MILDLDQYGSPCILRPNALTASRGYNGENIVQMRFKVYECPGYGYHLQGLASKDSSSSCGYERVVGTSEARKLNLRRMGTLAVDALS